MKVVRANAQKRKPWMKWYTSDWRAEPTLRMVSRNARSVWVDLLGLMHESTLLGSLLLNGRIPTVQDLAKVLGDDPQRLAEWMDELEEAGVFSRDEDGTIYSRKMRHDAEISEKGRKDIQKRGGAWAPGKKQKDPNKNPNGDPNRGAIGDPTTQRLDNTKKEEELESTLSSSSQTQSSEAIASDASASKPINGELFAPKAESDAPKPSATAIDLEAQVWAIGKAYLIESGVSPAHAGGLIGKWRKQLGYDDLEVMRLLRRAQSECVSEPKAFIEGCINAKGKTSGKATTRQYGPRVIDDNPRGNFAAINARIVGAGGKGRSVFDA